MPHTGSKPDRPTPDVAADLEGSIGLEAASSPRPKERWIKDLSDPDGEFLETHISWVFLEGEDAWKVKKPVSFGFLDFSTIEKRHAACEAEVLLNLRLAPGVYLGCVPVTVRDDGGHRFGGPGEAVDWAVHMTRLPAHRRADIRLERDQLGGRDLVRVAERIAKFHALCRSDEATARFGTVEAIRANVLENFDQTRDTIDAYLGRDQVEEIESWQLRFLADQGDLFAARLRGGKVKDGHGDLRLEHIYLESAQGGDLAIIDCIEFNERFRFADVCADIAFLAMDLAWHRRADFAERFLAAYARASNDFDLYPLVDFYESYRAFVRGKISSFVAADPGIGTPARKRAKSDARQYFLLALASARRSLVVPRVIAVGGVIATGKSTVAEGLADRIGVPIVDADRTRKSLLEVPEEQPMHDPPWQGAYTPEATEKVYREMLRRADAVLRSGRPVILDASFRSREGRAAARQLAQRHGVPFLFIECGATPEVCRVRLRQRARVSGVSDGRLEIFNDFLAAWESVDELPQNEHVVIDTSLPLADHLPGLYRLLEWPEATGENGAPAPA